MREPPDPGRGPRAMRVACRIGAAWALGLAAAAVPVQAERRPEADLEALRSLRSERRAEGDRYRTEADRATAELAELRRALAALGTAQVGGETTAGDARGAAAVLAEREAALTARAAANRSDLSRLLGALQAYGRDPPPALLVSPRSATDAVRATILVEVMLPDLRRRARAYEAEAAELRRTRARLAAAGSTLAAAELGNDERRAAIERLLAEKTALERRLRADAEAADAAVAELALQSRSLGDLTARLPQAAETPSGAPVRLSLLRPAAGRQSSRFGGGSDGVRFRTEPGASVISPLAGRVEYAGPLRGWGGVLILSGPDGYHVVLAGLEAVAAGAGRPVAAGEPVGRMAAGSEGSAPELYLEVRRNGEPVDPARHLNTATAPAR